MRFEYLAGTARQCGTQVVVQHRCRAHGKDTGLGARGKGHRGTVAHGKYRCIALDAEIGCCLNKSVDQRQVGPGQPAMWKCARRTNGQCGLHGLLRVKHHLCRRDLRDTGIGAQGNAGLCHRAQQLAPRSVANP